MFEDGLTVDVEVYITDNTKWKYTNFQRIADLEEVESEIEDRLSDNPTVEE